MKIEGKEYRTIWFDEKNQVVKIIDQTKLPHQFIIKDLKTVKDAINAIKVMEVRGAPLIGGTAAYGIVLAIMEKNDLNFIKKSSEDLIQSRPTAINLKWAVDRMMKKLSGVNNNELLKVALEEAKAICEEDVKFCENIGLNGLKIIEEIYNKKKDKDKVNILTHCNAGWLATVDWGTALSPIFKANKKNPELGGHIGTFASAATLYDVGMNHFWRGKNNKFGGDLIYFQGHSAPGMYARAYLEGRLTEKQLNNFRQEVDGNGLSSYPHPWLMPKFWQFPIVSMGLGPIMSIYQARFTKYLINRGLLKDEGRKIWTFLGDGETDEPESLGAIGLASREKLDNLIFVINCNLQRLDGPVRGNGKIIQELEGIFRGAGWNVIKVIWGSYWDPLLTKDKSGLLIKRMNECVDGEYQAFKANDGGYVREKFFGKYPKLKDLVSTMTDKIYGNLIEVVMTRIKFMQLMTRQ